jgi:iron(III) transport system ATP-binding protein
VAVGRAIVREPKVFLFDEPLSNLDAKLRVKMRTEISRLHSQLAATMIYVTHDQVEAMSISDVIVVMNQGKVMQIGSPFDIYARPENSFVADFIGRVNFIDGTVESVDGDTVVVSAGTTGNRIIGKKGTELAIGEPARVVLRPESLSDRKEERINSLSGKVLKYVFLGSNVEYELELSDGRKINAVTLNPIERKLPVVGRETELYFSRESAWVIRA